MNLLDYLQNNKEGKIFDEVLSNKSEGLMLDMGDFLSLLEQYFCNVVFSKIYANDYKIPFSTLVYTPII